MDRRAAGALLALAACFACSAAAPTASNQTALDLYEGAQEGCYYNFQHYGEGDRIMTNEPCLNCTCHNRMLMCYLRVCPFTKAIGQDCTVEKRADQCCPIVTCPDVPVDLLTSTSTTSPAEYGATGLGKLDKYGCSISGKYFPEGSKVPPTPNKPCEHCYCIRNMTTCVMQECTLHVDGCTPIYHKDVCCPVRYSCDHPEDEVPLLDDMSTTVRPTPGFLLTTTTISPVTQMTQDCIHDDRVFSDGALIKTEKACEHCYCMKGDIVCVVQECGAPMENEGKNCTSLPPREGQCCPDTYICEGDELTSDLPTESTTESIIEKLTTLSPPRRTSVEGSGYRNEPDEAPYTDMPEVEGSGEEEETSKPFGPDEIIPTPGDDDQYIYVTTKRPAYEEGEKTTLAIDKNIIPDIKDKTSEPHVYLSTTPAPVSEEVEKLTTSGIIDEAILEPHKHAPTTKAPESVTTELGDLQNTVPDVIPDEEIAKPHEYAPSTTNAPTSESLSPIEGEDDKLTTSEKDVIMSATSKPEFSTTISSTSDEIEKETDTPTHISNVTPEVITEKEYTDGDITRTTIATSAEEGKETSKPELLSPSSTISTDKESTKPEELAPSTTSSSFEEEQEIYKPDQLTPSTTSSPPEEEEKITTELDHAQNTVAVSEEDSTHPHSHISTTWASSKAEEESTTALNLGQDVVTDEVTKEGVLAPDEHFTTAAPSVKETEFTTAEPDRGLNTIPSAIYEETSSESPLPGRTTISEETKETEPSIITDEMQTQGIEIKSTTDSDLTTPLPDSSVTKGDQFTITTEPSFRKEDEGIVSTEKPKEIGSTTVKSEFVDEGLIPTSSHDDKIGSSDAPTAEEDFTTSVPEYITEVAETIESKQTTTESPKETSIVTEILPEKVSKPSSEPDGDLPDTTDKQTEVTPVVEIHEEPSRIPGEGDCLLNGVTYRNNTVVPSTNNCHTGCRCASSIIKCDPIICSPPPDYMDNCQSIYDSPDSCCPTFVCDHPRETVPPQSDNQMSGTESPMPSPTIECRGDQCEISVPTKEPTGPSEPCTSGSCLTASDHKTETECGSEGCGDVSQKPDTSLPSVQPTEDCTDGKCKPESCVYGECQSTQTQVSPVTPCEGEHCEKSDEFVPGSPQQCNNEEDCKTIKIPTVDAVPCEGELCNKIDCADGNCDSDVSAPLPDHQMEPCKDEDGCKPQDIPVPECTGDEPCRRKEVSASDTKIPTTCEGPNCISEKETTSAQGVIDLSTESPKLEETPSEEATEKIEVEKTTELPDSYISKPADDKIPTKDTQEPDMYTTEGQTDKTFTSVDSQKEKPVVEDETTKTTTAIETMVEGDEKTPGAKEEITQKPIIIEKEETEAPNVIDAETTKPTTLVTEGEEPTIDEEKGTEKPIVVKDKDTKEPTLIDDEGKEKPAVIEKEGPEPPLIDREKDTEKPVMIDEDTKDTPYLGSTKKPDIIDEEEGMTKPVITAEETTTIPDTEKKETDAPAIIDEISTNIPADTDEISKDKPVDTEKDTEKPIIVDEEGKPTDIDVKDKDKPEQEPVEKISSEKPALIEKEGTDKNAVEEATENPDVIKEETTVKTIVPDKDEKEKPDDGKDETTEELTIIEEKSTETPASVSDDDKPAIVEEDGKEKPAIIDETSTGKPIAEDTDKKPVTFEHGDTEKPTPVDKESTEKPLLEQDVKTEPAIVDQESTERIMTSDDLKPETSTETEGEPKEKPAVVAETTKPDLIDEEKSSENPLVTIVDGSETTPAIVDKDTDKPVLVDKDGVKKPAVIEIEGTTPTDIEVERTELPVDVGEENTQMPVIIDEQSTIIPITEGDTLSILKEESTVAPEETEEKGTAKPFIIDEGTEEPNIIEKEDATKPALIEREGTELPAVIGEEGTDKPLLIDEETKEKPDLTDQEDTKITAMVEKETDKPGVIEEGTEEPSTFETEATVKPALIDEAGKPVDDDDAKKPIQVEEEKHQEKPVVDKKEDKPIIIDEEITDKPIVDEVVSTEEPKKHEEEGSGTEIPEALHTVEPEKEVSPEITDTTITEIERTTKIPYSESQTTIVHETPEIMVTDTVTKEPFIHDYSRIPEITTESLIEQQMTTKTSVPEQEKITISEQVEVTTFKVDTSDVKEEGSTVGQDLINEEPALTTKAPVLHETSESTEKTTEMGLTSEPEEISTDTSEIESPATRAPGTVPVIIEPQEGIDADKPEPHVTSKTEEESTTKVYEEDKIKPSSESHVTEASSTSPEYETSDGITDVSEITDEHKPKPQSPELVTELDRTTTQVSPLEIKTDHPEIYVSDKQEPGTETQGYSVTEPVRRVTDIEDISVTGQEEIATGYPEVTKDHHVPSATDKIDESGDVGITSSEKPLLTDMETQDLPEKSLESDKPVTKVPEDYQTPEAEKEKPIDEIVSPATEIPISIVTESHETSDVPEKDVSSYVDKSTIIPDLSDHKHKDTTPPIGYTDQQELDTEIPQHHVTSTEEEMKVSEPYVTEPYITEPQETSTKSVEREIKDSQTITTDIPSISDKEGETETRAPELMHTGSHDLEPSVTEMQKLSTDLPISSEDVLTELPGVQISSEAPQSLVTEQKESLGEQTTVSIIPKEESSYKPDLLTTQFEEISKGPEQHVTEKEVQTEAPIHVTEQVEVSTVKPEEGDKITHVFEEAVTDKQDTATTLRESPAVTDKIEQIEVMKSTEHTSAQTEFSETTPYLIELQEHTHKIVEDITTVSPSEEEHTDKLVEDTSTPSPSEDEHSYKPVEDITTPSPSEEEHSYKPVEDISTSSPSEEEHSYKPVEDISTPSPSEEEHSYKPVEDISTSSPSEEEHSYKPVGDISTSSTSEEHSYKPVEDISTSSPSEEEHSYKPVEDISTSSPSEEEHSYKPVEDISTSSPSEEEHSYKPVEDISTSLPAEEEHSHKPVEDISTSSPSEDEHSYKPVEEISTSSPSQEEHSYKPVQDISTSPPPTEEYTPQTEEHVSELTTKKTGEEIETATKETEATISESVPVEETTPVVIQGEDSKYTADHKEYTTAVPTQISEDSTPAVSTGTEKLPISESDIAISTEKEISTSERPSHPIVSHETTPPEEEFIFSTTKATTISQEEDIVTPVLDDKFGKPEEKPTETSEVPPSSTTTEVSKPGVSDLQPTDEIPVPDEDGHFPPSGTSGYGEPDYVEEDQAFGPGTCRYGGKVYVSAQQIPRDDPCDFCFCFRSDIICLQQSCPPPIHGCHEEPIQGFCCPRYECPVSMATTVNVTTTTTTTTTTVPPNFPTHSYKGAAQRRGCQIKGHTYKVGEVVRSSSGPCLHCTCGGDGQMKCDPKACTPEPMLRQMIAAAVSAKRRR